MPQEEAKFQINQFTGGLVTDANPIGEQGPISIDENNCEIMSHGGRRRRRGAGLEIAYELHPTPMTDAQKELWALGTYEWKAVAGVPGLEFVVYQQGPTLYFYDKSSSVVSAGLKSFSVNLSSFKTTSATTTELQRTRVSVATGKGAIFVCGSTIEPFSVTYDPVSDSITTSQITIKIRDFEEQAPEVGPQDEISGSPTTARHLYDLLNQGWYQRGPWLRDNGSTNRDEDPVVVLYFGHSDRNSTFPRKNTPWHVGKYLVPADTAQESDTFISPQQVHAAPSGSTLAPFGHYILDAFYKDRKNAIKDEYDLTVKHFLANLAELKVEREDDRPNANAFYAGRAWWVLDNNIYFSQQLNKDSLEKAGRCYQEGDPTNEGESDIVATDGGFIPVPNMGQAIALGVTDNALIVLADNGVWSVSGTGGASFTAVDYTVNKISNIRCKSPYSLVEAEGLVFFWSETGIHVITPGEVRDVPDIKDLTEARITEFYKSIPDSSKQNVTGIYNPLDKTIHWMYKASADSQGLEYNRFAYDRFLNFSLKFSAFFPWSVDATATNQIFGGTISSGVLVAYAPEAVTDSGLVDVTDSGGTVVTVNRATTLESSNVFKFAALKNNAATFGEFNNLFLLDWDEDNAGIDYSSYIETMYHMQGDPMAFMQAPYVYVYFRRTEEDTTPMPGHPFSYEEIVDGGLTFSASFVGQTGFTSGTLSTPKFPTNAGIIVGEDGNRYQIQTGGGGVGTGENVRFFNIDTSTYIASMDLTPQKVFDDLDAAGITPPGGNIGSGPGDLVPFVVPDTPYVIIIKTIAQGVSTQKNIAYYKINSSSLPELVGGYAGKTGGLTVQFSPNDLGNNAIHIVGWANGYSENIPTSDPLAETMNTVPYQYPIVLGYTGEGRSSCYVIPPINTAYNGNIGFENTADHWENRELKLATWMDANILRISDHPGNAGGLGDRGFVFPRQSGGAKFFIKPNQNDIDKHNAATESTTSTWVQTYDGTYPTGFISSLDIAITPAPSNAFKFTFAGSNPVGGAHVGAFVGFPFSDETDDSDMTAGLATDNYYCNPSYYPTYLDDISAPWITFWPKMFRGDTDYIKIRVGIWDPITEVHKFVDDMEGVYIDFADINEANPVFPDYATVYWDRTNGDVLVGVRLSSAGEDHWVWEQIGTYDPNVNGVASWFGLPLNGEYLLESSCIMNTRWDWANLTASGKVSGDIQVYRGGRAQFVTDPDAPEPTGLPVYVSKNKTRGRGRVLQLRFRSEQGKDFELYGWAVWSRKNTRF